jgi:hypothetical protein
VGTGEFENYESEVCLTKSEHRLLSFHNYSVAPFCHHARQRVKSGITQLGRWA